MIVLQINGAHLGHIIIQVVGGGGVGAVGVDSRFTGSWLKLPGTKLLVLICVIL